MGEWRERGIRRVRRKRIERRGVERGWKEEKELIEMRRRRSDYENTRLYSSIVNEGLRFKDNFAKTILSLCSGE